MQRCVVRGAVVLWLVRREHAGHETAGAVKKTDCATKLVTYGVRWLHANKCMPRRG